MEKHDASLLPDSEREPVSPAIHFEAGMHGNEIQNFIASTNLLAGRIDPRAGNEAERAMSSAYTWNPAVGERVAKYNPATVILDGKVPEGLPVSVRNLGFTTEVETTFVRDGSLPYRLSKKPKEIRAILDFITLPARPRVINPAEEAVTSLAGDPYEAVFFTLFEISQEKNHPAAEVLRNLHLQLTGETRSRYERWLPHQAVAAEQAQLLSKISAIIAAVGAMSSVGIALTPLRERIQQSLEEKKRGGIDRRLFLKFASLSAIAAALTADGAHARGGQAKQQMAVLEEFVSSTDPNQLAGKQSLLPAASLENPDLGHARVATLVLKAQEQEGASAIIMGNAHLLDTPFLLLENSNAAREVLQRFGTRIHRFLVEAAKTNKGLPVDDLYARIVYHMARAQKIRIIDPGELERFEFLERHQEIVHRQEPYTCSPVQEALLAI